MERAAFWIVGGPNGAGKTTLISHSGFQRLLRGVRFLNPDRIALQKIHAAGWQGFHDASPEQLRRCFIEAAHEVERELCAGVARGEAIGVESVLSTRKYCPLVEQVLGRGGFFGLIYVALRNAELSRERVARRVAQGGHDVPSEKLPARWNRSVENLGWFARRASRFWIFDNSDSTLGVPPRLIAEGGRGTIMVLDAEAIPKVTHALTEAPGG